MKPPLTELELRELENRLSAREAELIKREARLIDDVTMQAISLVLLQSLRKNGKIKPAHLNEIRFAREQFGAGDYQPREKLLRVLSETAIDREQRRDTPQG